LPLRSTRKSEGGQAENMKVPEADRFVTSNPCEVAMTAMALSSTSQAFNLLRPLSQNRRGISTASSISSA
jgi:hypothetical protein